MNTKYDTTKIIVTKHHIDSVVTIYDTIPCIMLVSDTTKQTITSERWKLTCDTIVNKITEKKIIDTISYEYNHKVFWQYGFYIDIKTKYYYKTHYLDIHKKPLSKNYIVWMSTIRN